MKKHLQFTAIFSLLLLTAQLSLAGGWTQKKGSAFIKVGTMFTRASNFYDEQGVISPIRTIGTYSTSVYAEYGLADRLTGVVYAPFFVRNTLNRTVGRRSGEEIEAGAVNNSLGDADIGVRYGIIQNKPFVLAASLTLGLPIGDANDENALLTGDGEFNQLLMLEAGYGGNKWYATAGIGFNHRTRGFSEEIRYNAEFGYQFLGGKLLGSLKVFGVESLQNGDVAANTMGLFANNVAFLSYGPELSYTHKGKFGVSVAAFSAARGKNVLAAPAYSAGIHFVLQ